MKRICACGCGAVLIGKRSDATWASKACALRWTRANPGKPPPGRSSAHIIDTRPRSGRQVSGRKMEVLLVTRYGMTPRQAFAAVNEALPVKQKRASNVIPIHARNKKTRDQRDAAGRAGSTR